MPQKLNEIRLFLYNSAEAGIIAVDTMTRIYILVFYVSTGLNPELAGLAMTIAIGFDAISDPIMGRITDSFKSSFGHRRVFFIPGAIVLISSFIALFCPVVHGDGPLFLWLLISYVGVSLGLTILAIPHLALTVDIVDTEYNRSKAFAYRYFFSVVGMLVGTGVPGFLLTHQIDHPHPSAAIVLGGIVLITALISFISSQGHDPSQGHTQSSRSNITKVMKKKWFIVLTISWVLSSIAQTINAATALYYYRFFLLLPESEIQIILLSFILSICGSLPLWVVLSKKFPKGQLIAGSIMILAIVGAAIYPILPKEMMLWPLIIAGIGGVLIGSGALLGPFLSEKLMQNNVQDFGVYFGFWKMSGKLARAIGIGLTGITLRWMGWDNDKELFLYPERLAYLFGPVVGIFFVLSAILLWWAATDDHHRKNTNASL